MPPLRVLFVDDEETIRLTLPPILEAQGFAVVATATVAEALAQITSKHFDVLIADLNVGQPGDGFTVVSAMRRTQPNCVNFILTGYPAFETALEAIRNQVDDYLVKPIEIESLVESVTNKVKAREPRKPLTPKRVATILGENVENIIARALAKMKAHPELRRIHLSDTERTDHLPTLLATIVGALESNGKALGDEPLRAAAQHGRLRSQQGYSLPLMVEDTRVVDESIYELVQENLLTVDVSRLIFDLQAVNRMLELQLKESLREFSSKAS